MIHESVRQTLAMKSEKVKLAHDRKARDVIYSVGQKVWLFNSRRIKGKAPKLQRE